MKIVLWTNKVIVVDFDQKMMEHGEETFSSSCIYLYSGPYNLH